MGNTESTEVLPNSSEDQASIEIGEVEQLFAVQMEEMFPQTIKLSSQIGEADQLWADQIGEVDQLWADQKDQLWTDQVGEVDHLWADQIGEVDQLWADQKDQLWADQMKGNLNECSIYRVPDIIRTASKEEYVPQIFSREDEASIEIGEVDQLFAVQMEEMFPQTIKLSSQIGEADQLLADEIDEKVFRTSSLSDQCCIYRVPVTIRTASEKEYVPQIVSIGPFHRGKESCKAAERFKRLHLYSLISRAPPQTNFECLIEDMRSLEQDCRQCYAEYINLSSDEFVEMMLIDGCFILEMFRNEAETPERPIEDFVDDPVFTTPLMQSRIKSDFILVENQIPLLILQRLFDLTVVPEHKYRTLIDLCRYVLEKYVNVIVPMGTRIVEGNSSLEGANHLLDLIYNSYISPEKLEEEKEKEKEKEEEEKEKEEESGEIIYINCATELHEAGVTFKKNDEASSMFHITFKKGVFMIPPLTVEDNTETLLRNLIACEQCSGYMTQMITSYAFLMDSLINSAKDVQLLRHKGIITHRLGSDKEVSDVINKLCREVVLHDYRYRKLCKKVKKHCGQIWHSWEATFRRDYFDTPWKVFGFFAAIILLIGTTVGAIFGTLSYWVHNS